MHALQFRPDSLRAFQVARTPAPNLHLHLQREALGALCQLSLRLLRHDSVGDTASDWGIPLSMQTSLILKG